MSAYDDGHAAGEDKAWEDVLYLFHETDDADMFMDAIHEELVARGWL